MSKITKLIKNPKQFFVDSIYFGYANVKLVNVDNLFIVTTFAQLKNIENLIRLEGLENNYLLVLYTNANLKMPRLILKNVDRSLFEVIDKFKLPIKPGSVDIVKARYFIRSYQRLINGILPTSLYLFSFEGHYTILRNIAKSNSIKIIIVEEGTASYKDLKLIGFENKNFTHKEEIIKKLPFCQDVFGYIDKADVIYSAFPELMLSQFEATNSVTFIHPLFASFRASSKDLIAKYNINGNDGIYVNQKYHIDMEDHTNSVINILMEIAKKSNNRIFVKMHPNDSPKLKDLFRSRISEIPSNLICFIDEESFLIEALLAELKPNMLIGLTSTSLVYSSLISPKTKNVTIAKEFLNRVESNSKNIVGCNTINVHLDILKKFNNLTEYGAGEFYPLLNKDNKHHIYEDYIFYKIIDYKDYFFEKYMSDLNGADFSNIEEWLYLRFYSVQNISEEDIIWFENYDYQVLLKNDNSLLRKYILYKKFKSSNYFKSFYYLELIKLEIGILPSSLELDYVKLFYLSGLYFYQPRQVLKYIDSFNLKQQNLIIEENIMSLLLGGDISKFPFKRTKQYRFAESILKGDRVEISNYICTNFDNYLEKSFFDVSLLLLSNIFYSTHRLEKECLYFKASRNVERFIVKSLFLILQNRSDEVDVNRLNYFKTVCKNQSVDFLLIVIHLFYVEAVSPNKLKAILIGYERSGYDFIIFKRYLLYYFYKIKNIKSFSKLFEDLSSLNLSFSNEFWLYYYSLGVDIDKIGVALNNNLMLKDYGNYVLIVRLVLNYSLTNNDMELLRKLVSHQNLSYNKQILETKVLTNPMQLRAFYAHFSLKP